LALFEARVFLVDDVDTALPADNLAVRGTAFNGSANSHGFISILALEEGVYARGAKTKKPSRGKAREYETIKSQTHGKRLVQVFYGLLHHGLYGQFALKK
jgi:hypothetical protein